MFSSACNFSAPVLPVSRHCLRIVIHQSCIPKTIHSMNLNARRHTNRLQFAALVRGIIITVFLGTAGLSYVYLKNQLHVSGSQRKGLEQELNELISENNVMEAQISKLTSRTALQRRLDEGFIKLVPITGQAIVRVHSAETSRWASEDRSNGGRLLQAVSHEPAGHR